MRPALLHCALSRADVRRLRFCFFHTREVYSLRSSASATCPCVFPPWITSSTAWRLNSSLYLRAILLFTVAFILLCALVSAKLGEVHGSFLHCFHYYSLSSSLALLTHPVCIDLGPAS